MTDKQRKFADEYVLDCNGTRAYKAAYPNVKKDSSAATAASRLLRNVEIKAYIDELLEKISSEKIADALEVMEYLTGVLRGASESEIVVVEGTGEGCSSARAVKKAPDEKERLKAAELIGKHLNMFTDKLKLDGPIPIVISGADELED